MNMPWGGGASTNVAIGNSTVYWGNSKSKTEDQQLKFQIIYSNGHKYLKAPTNFSQTIIPLYGWSVFKHGNNNYANLTCSAVLLTKDSVSKTMLLEQFRNYMKLNSFYPKDIYNAQITDEMIENGEDCSEGPSVIIHCNTSEFTQSSIPSFDIERKVNLKSLTWKHGDSDTTEYVPVQDIVSGGLSIGKIASGNEFEFSADIDTSATATFLSTNVGNYRIRLDVKSGKIVGEMHPTVTDELNKFDTIIFNKPTAEGGDWGTLVSPSGDINGLRKYKYSCTKINEEHLLDKWQVKRVSDDKIFWVEVAKASDASDNFVPKGELVYDTLLNSNFPRFSKENEFEYVDPSVQGSVQYLQQHNFSCYNGETEIFNVSFKVHKPVDAEVNFGGSAFSNSEKSYIVLTEAKLNSETMPEFWTQYDVPEQENMIGDGTYLITTEDLSSATYKVVPNRYCRKDNDGVWVNNKLSNCYIVGSFTVLCNSIVDTFVYPQI